MRRFSGSASWLRGVLTATVDRRNSPLLTCHRLRAPHHRILRQRRLPVRAAVVCVRCRPSHITKVPDLPASDRVTDSQTSGESRISARRLRWNPRPGRMCHSRMFRPILLFLSLALLPWQAVSAAFTPRQACCSLNPAAGQCRRECPIKASPEHEAGAAGPSKACHRSSSASGASAKCGIRSRCSSDHSKAIWNPEAPYLPAFAAELPLLARMPFQPSPLTPDWPRRHDSPPAPPPQPAIPG